MGRGERARTHQGAGLCGTQVTLQSPLLERPEAGRTDGVTKEVGVMGEGAWIPGEKSRGRTRGRFTPAFGCISHRAAGKHGRVYSSGTCWFGAGNDDGNFQSEAPFD